MIVSERLKLLFIEVPRTGTTSMAEALLTLPDAIRISRRKTAHHTEVPVDAWREFFTFATVRNPYAREYSVYQFRRQYKEPQRVWHKGTVSAAQDKSFKQYIRWLQRGKGLEFDTPMAVFLRPVRIDKLLRFEDLPGCFEDLDFAREFNLELPKLNTIIDDDWRTRYDKSTADVVWEYAREDFKTFGYDRDSWRGS